MVKFRQRADKIIYKEQQRQPRRSHSLTTTIWVFVLGGTRRAATCEPLETTIARCPHFHGLGEAIA